MTSGTPLGPEGEDSIERLLEKGLIRPPLTEEAAARIHAAVMAEWRAAVKPRSPRSPQRWAAIAAGIAAALLIAAVLLQPFAKTSPLGVVARVDGGALVLRHDVLPDQPLKIQSPLHAGDVLIARGAALVELQGGGSLRIARGSRLRITATNGVSLDKGEVYMDIPPDLHRPSSFGVLTPYGLVEHLGTQFDVVVDNELLVRVREGRVRLRRGSQTETAGAGTELVVSGTGTTNQRLIATHGPEWSWVEALEPDYTIENRKLIDFLQWAGRETGRQVRFLDTPAREVAERTLLHGSVRGLSATDALKTVIATTSLRYNFEQDWIEVSSGG